MRAVHLIIGIGLLILTACTEPDTGHPAQTPFSPQPYEHQDPPGFVPMLLPADNPMTVEGVELGRRLFFDPVLSADNSISCASCHLPALAFTDGKAQSNGVLGRRGMRSSPSLVNVGYYYKGLFWDGRVMTLEEQSLHPVADSLEMAASWPEIEQRLRSHSEYPALFQRAFGIQKAGEINRYWIGRALAQYQRTLVSADSKFDKKTRGETTFTEMEQRGWTIFFDASPSVPNSECGHCHIDPLFTTLEFHNNGLDAPRDPFIFPDPGRGGVTGNRFDNGTFRVPTLRNIALTAPYMHDGRFATLEEVIDHYASGGHYADNLNPNIMELNLDARDKAALIAFLHTLTDDTFLAKHAGDGEGVR
jgi:cytochrome c peroxidase